MLKLASKNTAIVRITAKMHGITSLSEGQKIVVSLPDNNSLDLIADETPQPNPRDNEPALYTGKLRVKADNRKSTNVGASAAASTRSLDPIQIRSRIVQGNGNAGQHAESGEGHGRGDVIRTLEDTITIHYGAGKSDGDLFGQPVDFEENTAGENQDVGYQESKKRNEEETPLEKQASRAHSAR